MINMHRIREIQDTQLSMLEKFSELCKENDLRFFLFYGSLLGAVRHKKMIPWDDDIDIVMLRKDYNQLLLLSEEILPYPYVLQTSSNDAECFYGGYSKLRNSDTTAIEMVNWEHECNHGIWIDIFPLDYMEEDNELRDNQLNLIKNMQRLLYAKTYSKDCSSFRDISPDQWMIYGDLASCIERDWLISQLDNALTECKQSSYVSVLARYCGNEYPICFPYQYFEKQIETEFSGIKLPIPMEWKSCLLSIYGERYLQLPNAEEQIPKHRAFFDCHTKYKEYSRRFFGLLGDAGKKEIVIFGAGIMFDEYIKRWGADGRPSFIVDNNQSKWGSFRNGVLIKSPEELLKIPKEKLYLIICNIYYRQIEIQLKEMGIQDYHIFVQEKAWLEEDPET